MSAPLVSIIIPVYNGENYLREAIDSALAQTYTNIEVIVVNDGSSDHGATEKIVVSYGNKVRYFSKENGGVATALNLAIREMKGEYFSWLSHDDMYYPNKVERQIRALYEQGDMTAIVHSAYNLLDAKTQTVTNVVQSNMYSEEQLRNSVFPVLQGLIHGCSLLIHKSHFNRVGNFNEKLITTQDYDLWFRMMRYQKTIYLSEPLVLARIHGDQGSKTISCHDLEREQLHIGFINELSESEINTMYGHSYIFYHRMACFFKGGRMYNSYQYANKKLQDTDVPEDIEEKLLELQKYIDGISNGQANRICIFCAGDYGIRLYEELRSKMIAIDFFSDNDSNKWGYLFDNVHCISPKMLELEKERTLVIVATRTPVSILNDLEAKGFPFVTTKQEIDKMLFNIPPVKRTSSLEENEDNFRYMQILGG
ncbi:glycosyltransferase [Paenibacillus ottowii]